MSSDPRIDRLLEPVWDKLRCSIMEFEESLPAKIADIQSQIERAERKEADQ
jgi:hypothetical protein